MKSKNLSLGWILHFLIICLFVQISKAEITLFSIDSHREPAAVRVYSIDGYALTNPVTISEETIGLGPVGIAVSEDLGLIFITYENVDDVVVINSKTLQKVTKVDTLVYYQSGIVADDVKDKIYIIERATDNLYSYTWNETTKDLELDDDAPHELPDLYSGMGIALDGDYLYVSDMTATVRCYNTTTTPWAHETDYDITLPQGNNAWGIAIYHDPLDNRYGYFGGYSSHNNLIRVNLDDTNDYIIVTPSKISGEGVNGIATDPDTGLVYASIDDGSNRVFNTSLTELYSIDTNVSGPAGMVVGGLYQSPFDPNKTDDIEDCVPPRDGQITYTINYDYLWNEEGDPEPNDFESMIVVDELPLGVDFVEQSSDPCWVYHENGHYATYAVEPNYWDETSDIELVVQVNRKVPPGGKIENIVKVKAYLDNQEHIGSYKTETNVCDCTGYGEVIYVDFNASGNNNGSTWQDAYTNLQSGLKKSWPCDEIWVAKSENAYKPTTDPCDVKATFRLVSGVGVYGGFIGGQEGEAERYERNWFDNETIINGDINGSVDVEYVVTSDANAPVSVLDGFTIKNGSVAGVYCENSSPTIQHNKITESGTGIYCFEPEQTVIKNNWIYKNVNGIYIPKSYNVATVRNNTVANNEEMGIYLAYGVEPEISNCIIWGHPSDTNDLVGCTATYSCIEDGDEGEGNISSDPCFVSAGTDDYHLKADSPCIDAGDPNGKYGSERDIDKHFRVLDGGVNGKIVDMGADEYCNETSSNDADFSGDGVVNYLDFAIFGDAWLSEQGDGNWNVYCDLIANNIIDVNDLTAFAQEWLWMSCEGMKSIPMMEMMMGMGGGMDKMAGAESMLISEPAAEQISKTQPEPSIAEQIEQIKYLLDWLYEIKNEIDEDTWLNLTTGIEEMLKELQDSQ